MESPNTSAITVQKSPTALSALFRQAGLRIIQYPVATGVGALMTAGAAGALAVLPGEWAGVWPARVVGGMFAGGAIMLVLSALMAVETPNLAHLSRLMRVLAVIAAGFSAVFGGVICLVGAMLPEAVLSGFEARWGGPWLSSLGFVSLGAVFLASIWPAILVAWPIYAKGGVNFVETVVFVKRHVEEKHVSPLSLEFSVGLFGILLSWVPGVGLIVPTVIANLATVFEEQMVETKK